MRSFLIVLLVIALGGAAFLADRLVREENQRYALLPNLCPPSMRGNLVVPDFDCLYAIQTRNSWLEQFNAAIRDPIPAVPLHRSF